MTLRPQNWPDNDEVGARRSCDGSCSTADALRELGHQPEVMSRAIRHKCLDCSGGSPAEVRDCLVRNCALFPFRMGKNPWRAPLSDAAREKRRQHLAGLKNARENTGETVSGVSRGTGVPTLVVSRNAREIPEKNGDCAVEADVGQKGGDR
jgi:hypothetical protein